MPRRRKGQRILGPYRPSGRRRSWRVRHILADGESVDHEFPTESGAKKAKAELEAAIAGDGALKIETIGEAIAEYLSSDAVAATRKSSQERTGYALRRFFADHFDDPLWSLTPTRGGKLYQRLVGELAVDSHRGYLAQSKTFLNWCCKRGLLSRNPLADVKGVGKRKRGKPQLRYRDSRQWYRTAMGLAENGDDGAIAALINLVMSMRSSEVCQLRVRDVDEAELPGDTLWIDRSKTDKGERVLEVPEPLRPLLLGLCLGKRGEDLLFPSHDKRGRVLRDKPHWRDWIAAQVRRICTEAGVPVVHAQSMRGHHGTLAVDRGVTPRVVADSLGHESEKTTLGHYAEKRAQRSQR
ncbi:MAG: site-specific integrase, partial [Myxococcota bacterium]